MTTTPTASTDADDAVAGTRCLPQLLVDQARATPDAVALRHKAFGRWASTTWRAYADQVARVAAGLRALGVGDGDRVAIVSDNRPEWLVADLAVQALGAASVGIDPGIEPVALQHALAGTGAVVALAEDEEQYDKLVEVRAAVESLRTIVVIDPRGIALGGDGGAGDGGTDDGVRTLARVDEAGQGADVDSLSSMLASVTPAHMATLVPDGHGTATGAQLTQADLLGAAGSTAASIAADRSTEVLSYLPLSLVAERIVSEATALLVGFVVCFGDGGDSFLTDMQQVQPTFVLGVPLVFETIRGNVEQRMQDASFLKRKTYSWAMARGRHIGAARRAGRLGIGGKVVHGVGWLVLYRPLRLKLGLLRARDARCVPAPDDPAVLDLFWALGVPVRAGTLDQQGIPHLDAPEAAA